MKTAMCGVLILVLLTLVVEGDSSSSNTVSNDVLLEKLDSISNKVTELNTTFKDTKTARDAQIKDLSDNIVAIKIEIASMQTKLNIMWGLFGATLGGGGIVSGIFLRRRRCDDEDSKTKE